MECGGRTGPQDNRLGSWEWDGVGQVGNQRTVNHDSRSWHSAKPEGKPRWVLNDIFRNNLLRNLQKLH